MNSNIVVVVLSLSLFVSHSIGRWTCANEIVFDVLVRACVFVYSKFNLYSSDIVCMSSDGGAVVVLQHI